MGEAANEPVVRTELSKDDLLKYVELDLWGRFQDRLWKVVGIVLTIFTIVGLLGIPYYIRNEVNSTLQKQAADFKQRTDAILAYSKLLASLTAHYDSERYRFDADVYRLIDAVKKWRSESGQPQTQNRFDDPEEFLAQLASRTDFSKVVEGSLLMTRGLTTVPEDLKGKRLQPRTSYMVENKGISGAGGYSETHPVRNGTYEGSLRDLRFRIVKLEALRRAIIASQTRLLTLGGVTELEKQVETVRVKSLESTEFNDALAREIAVLANSFLGDEDRKEFTRVQSLYLPTDVAAYKAPTATDASSSTKAAPAGK